MLRCARCEVICTSYEAWISHLVSAMHQARLGISEILTSSEKDEDQDRNERTLVMWKMNPKTDPYDVVCHFARVEPLGFITDAYVHVFPHVNEKFYLIVFDQKKFVDRIASIYEKSGDQKVVTSMVQCRKRTSVSEADWKSKVEASFFFRRHENLKQLLTEMNWDQQLTKLLSHISLDSVGYQKREAVMEELESLLHEESEEFQNATVNAFGSCMTWLADVNADLDVFVDITGDSGRSDLESDKKAEIMSQVSKILRAKYDAKNVVVIRQTRVPIIMLQHPSGLKVDISFENCLSVLNSKMIRLMTKLDYRVRPFLICLRYWAHYHNLIGPHSIKSYALVLLALVFLRKRKILPSVYELQSIEGVRPYMVCNWNAGFCANRDIARQKLRWLKCCRDPPSSDGMGHEIMKLCYGFFNEYSSFDFDMLVVCPLLGEYLTKKAFTSQYGVELPKEMELLKANLVTGQCSEFKAHRPLCVQDPFTLNINVTSSCANPDIVYTFKTACSQSADALRPFIKTYGLADMESILELCCQPISQARKEEIMMAIYVNSQANSEEITESDQGGLDQLAYVKTEATTTTNEDEPLDDEHNTITTALQSIKDFYKGQFGYTYDNSDTKSSQRNDHTKNGSNNNSISRGDWKPEQIKRTSIFDELSGSKWGQSSTSNKSLVNYDADADVDSNDDTRDLTNNKKAPLKSVVVVAGKASSGRSGSPNSSSSGTFRYKSERSSSSSISSPSKKKSRIELAKDLDSSDSEIESSKDELRKKKKKKSRSKSPKVEKKEPPAEPVVKFVHNPAKSPLEGLTTTQQPDQKENGKDAEEHVDDMMEFYKSIRESTLPRLTITVENIPSTSQCLTPQQLCDFNYGYKTTPIAQIPKTLVKDPGQVQKPSTVVFNENVPKTTTAKTTVPNYREAGEEVEMQLSVLFPNVPIPEPQPKLRFPDHFLSMEERFQTHFASFYSPLANIPDVMKVTKMKNQWSLIAADFFFETNFWKKLEPILESFEFCRVEGKEQLPIFEKMSDQLASSPNPNIRIMPFHEMPKTDSPPILNKILDLPNWYTTGELSYQSLCFLMEKFSKLPQFIRKKSATAFCVTCYPEDMVKMYQRWKICSSAALESATVNKGPLETLAHVCEDIAKANASNREDYDLIPIKLLVAHETTTAIPTICLGFQTETLDSDPTYEKQVLVYEILKAVIQDLFHMYVIHRLHKYLHKP